MVTGALDEGQQTCHDENLSSDHDSYTTRKRDHCESAATMGEDGIEKKAEEEGEGRVNNHADGGEESCGRTTARKKRQRLSPLQDEKDDLWNLIPLGAPAHHKGKAYRLFCSCGPGVTRLWGCMYGVLALYGWWMSGTVTLEGEGDAVTFGRAGAVDHGKRKVILPMATKEVSRRQAEVQIIGNRLVVRAGGGGNIAVVVGRLVRPDDPNPTQLHPGELLILDGSK